MTPILSILLLQQGARAEGARLGLQSVPGAIANALSAFRQTSHPLADAMALNFEGDNLGRPNGTPVPLNFEAASDLLYRLVDFNSDGQPEAVLVFFWNQVAFRRALPGVIMQQLRRRWIFSCEFHEDEKRMVLLRTRDEGWRRFRVGGNVMGWRRPAEGPGAARECCRRPGRARRAAGGS